MNEGIARTGSLLIQTFESKGKGVHMKLKIEGHSWNVPVASCGVDPEGFYVEINAQQRKDLHKLLGMF